MGHRYAYLTRSVAGPAVFRPRSGRRARKRVCSPPCASVSGCPRPPRTSGRASTRSAWRSRSTTRSSSRRPTASSSRVEGEGPGRLDTGADNVVARGARMAFEVAGRPFRGARHPLREPDPAEPGPRARARRRGWAGSSAANALLGEPHRSPRALVALAARAEGHPDNVAAAVLGGLTVSCADGRARRGGEPARAARAPLGWCSCRSVESATREARAVLPDEVSRADAVFNVQRVSLLLAALGARAPRLLLDRPCRTACTSRTACRLFPWMEAVAGGGGRRARSAAC